MSTCRALNNYYADLFMDHPDRMTPVAVIPMNTPQEAIEELEYAVGKRGMRVVMMPSTIRRPIPGDREEISGGGALGLSARHLSVSTASTITIRCGPNARS